MSESVEKIMKRVAALVEEKRLELGDMDGQDKINKIMEPIARACLSVERDLHALVAQHVDALNDFLVREIVDYPPTEKMEVRRGRGRPLSVDAATPVIPFSLAYDKYVAFADRVGATPMTEMMFSKTMVKKGYGTARIRCVCHYVGIRLRTPADPVPKFPGEIITPPSITALKVALCIHLYLTEEIDPRAKAWSEERYDRCDCMLGLLDGDALHKEFVESTGIEMTYEQFAASTYGDSFDSYPDDYRWLLPRDTDAHADTTDSKYSATKHLFDQNRRRWLALRKHVGVTASIAVAKVTPTATN